MTHRSMRRKALQMSAEFETPVSLPVVLKGSMPSSSKQFIKTTHQSSLPKRQIETVVIIGLHVSPSAILLTDSLNLFHGVFYGGPNLSTSVRRKDT